MIATRTNRDEFCGWRISLYGGTFHNAARIWVVSYHEYWSRKLDVPYVPLFQK